MKSLILRVACLAFPLAVGLAFAPPAKAQTATERSGRLLEEAQKNLEEGRIEDAQERMRRVIEIGGSRRQQADAHLGLAMVARRLGNLDTAEERYREAIRLSPSHRIALDGLASLLGQTGRYQEAAGTYELLLDDTPDNVPVRLAQVTALIFAGEHAPARNSLERGLQAVPGNLDLIDVLARHLAACPDPAIREGARAVELAEVLFEGAPTPQSRETLAMAYAEAGRFADAVAMQELLIENAPDPIDPAIIEIWQANLARYQGGESCCAPRAAAPADG
ncbi:MAG: tetratricopeptide repeat protein [Acidobacteriota bacterium]